MGQEECESCGKRVYLMERLAVEHHVFHRTCFKCHSCSTQLKQGSYEFDRISNRFYCRTHYRDLLRQRTIKRTIDQRNLASPTRRETEGEGKVEEGEGEPKRKKGPDDESHGNEVTGSKVATTEATANRHGDTGATTKTEATTGTVVLATPTDISREESARIRGGLPSLLKTLAASKQDSNQTESPTSPQQAVAGKETSATSVENGLMVTATGPASGGSPQQQSSGKPLPGKQLSGQHIATEKVVKFEVEKEREGERRGSRGEKEKSPEDVPPVKPPRRRTTAKKNISTEPSSSPVVAAAPAKVPGRHMFSCYFFIMCGLVVYCLIYGLTSFLTSAMNIFDPTSLNDS